MLQKKTIWKGLHRRQSYHQSAVCRSVDALAEEEQELNALVKSLDLSCTRYMMEISAETTITDYKQRQWHPEGDQGKRAEVGIVTSLKHLGAVVS